MKRDNIEILISNLCVLLFGILIGMFIYYNNIQSKIIEKHAKALDIMRYDSGKDKMVAKDSVTLSYYELYYLIYGDFKGW